jgi:hypothetical protein
MNLVPGQRLAWQPAGADSFVVSVVRDETKRKIDARNAIGYAKRFAFAAQFKSSDEAMAFLREGER